jgi:hypothetical protein
MATASTCAIALTGIEGHVIRIDAGIADGPARLVTAGLPDATARTTRDRVRAAIIFPVKSSCSRPLLTTDI